MAGTPQAVPHPLADHGFPRDSRGVTLQISNHTLRVEICSQNIVHIVFTNSGQEPRQLVPIVKQSWPIVPFTVKADAQKIVIDTGTLQIVVTRRTGRVRFLDRKGIPVLQEPDLNGKSLTPVRLFDEATWEPEQMFLSPPDEAFYGLGQRQEGIMNWRGIPVQLQQIDTQIAVPVVLSSKGYGIFWNNPSVTNFNPARERYKIDQETGNAKFTSGLAGVYGFMTVGGTSREETSLKVNDVTVMNLKNYWVPYSGSGKLSLDAHTEYTLHMTGGGKDAAVVVRPPADTMGFRSEAGNAIDYYFFYGPDLNDVIAEYREATGTAPLFPRWAYGFWQCRERYSTQAQLLDAGAGFRERHLPIDVIVQDWQYWGKYSWNAMRFDEANYPDPGAMVRQLHAEDIHFVISVWSKFAAETEIYKKMRGGSLLVPGTEWFDAFNPRARELYWESINVGLGRSGVDGWWLDATEPEDDILNGRQTFLGLGNFVRNAYPFFVTQAVYQGQRRSEPDKRVAILTRAAYAGQQRNAATSWSGDISGNWTDFRRQIPAGLNFTMTGIPYWTTDTGGFVRPKDQYTSPAYHELLARWIEYSAFCPLFRMHGDQTETEIWKFGKQVEDIFRKYDRLRYRMLPYIYSTAWKVTNDGYTPMRGLPLDFRNDPNTFDIPDQFMFGASMLVNPVTEAGATNRTLYLPQGQDWWDFWTGETSRGGTRVDSDAPLDKIPLYVRAGSILPLGPANESTVQNADPMELRIYPGRNADFVLYEDDGETYGYERGDYSTIPIHWDDSSSTLTIGPRAGDFPGMPKQRVLRLVWVSNGHGVGPDMEAHFDQEVHFDGSLTEISKPR